MWNIYQKRPFARPISKPQQILKEYVFQLSGIKAEINNRKTTRK